jgi:hypothetical protein
MSEETTETTGTTAAAGRIRLEAKNPTEKRVLAYLEANASEVLAERINAGKKTLAGALGYAKDEARAMAVDGVACVDDATVYGWIIHFFEEDSITETARKAQPAVRVPKGVATSPKPVRKAKAAPKPEPEAKPEPVPAKPKAEQLPLFAEILGGAK